METEVLLWFAVLNFVLRITISVLLLSPLTRNVSQMGQRPDKENLPVITGIVRASGRDSTPEDCLHHDERPSCSSQLGFCSTGTCSGNRNCPR